MFLNLVKKEMYDFIFFTGFILIKHMHFFNLKSPIYLSLS